MRKILVKLCDFLERKLYAEPTYEELARQLDNAFYEMEEAKREKEYLQSIINQTTVRK